MKRRKWSADEKLAIAVVENLRVKNLWLKFVESTKSLKIGTIDGGINF